MTSGAGAGNGSPGHAGTDEGEIRVERRRALPALLVTPLLAVAGCSEQAPTDASVEEFCQEWGELSDARTGGAFGRVAESLRGVGTPGGISGDTRDGFEVFLRVASSLDEDATLDELVDPAVSNAEARDLKVFIDYASETCTALDEEAGEL